MLYLRLRPSANNENKCRCECAVPIPKWAQKVLLEKENVHCAQISLIPWASEQNDKFIGLLMQDDKIQIGVKFEWLWGK